MGAPDPRPDAARRATARLHDACDNACLFCAEAAETAGAERPLDAVEAALHALRPDASEVTFVGGEPTLAATLPAAVSAARRLGFRAIGLQTHGRHLAQDGLAERLAAEGLTDVHLSIHGARASVHDYHTGREGSFAELGRGLDAARRAGLTLVTTTLLTRSTYRVLSELPGFLASRGVRAWTVALVRVAGRAGARFDPLVPRLALALPSALHAITLARRLGLPSWLRDAPACLLGPHARHAVSLGPQAYGAPCAACAARPLCPGVDPLYLERFGDEELRPREALPPPDPAHAELLRLFVGPTRLRAPLPAERRGAARRLDVVPG